MAKNKKKIQQLEDLYAKFNIGMDYATSGENIDMERASKLLKKGESFSPGEGLSVIRMEKVPTYGVSGAGRDGLTRTYGTKDLAVYGKIAPAAPPPPPPPPVYEPPAPAPWQPPPEIPLPQSNADFGGYGQQVFQAPALQPATTSSGAPIEAPKPPPELPKLAERLAAGESTVVRDSPARVGRRRSSARESGQDRLGTGQLRIGAGSRAGQPIRATGLNIGRAKPMQQQGPGVIRRIGLGTGQ